MNINDIILSLGAERITQTISENCTDAELKAHLENNVLGAVLTVKQVRDETPIYQAKIDAAMVKSAKLKEIEILENQITPRRTREALLGVDNGWLLAQDAKISALRTSL